MATEKQEWKEIEFAKALGMSTNAENPGLKTAKRLLNVHTHKQPGKITLRPGYSLKYSPPSDSTIVYPNFLTFEMFMDKQIDEAGKEITCLIEKGTFRGLINNGNPVVTDTQDALCFWIRPYWDGAAWVDNWQLLNRILITKLTTASNVVFPNVVEVFGNSAQGLTNLVGWTIFNKTKGEYAKIITSGTDDTNTTICHTLYNSTWAVDDVIFLMKNYYDLDCLKELHNCDWTDIVFHKVNNDLRIGFGGQKDRKGISIGYRKKYLLLKEFGFTDKYENLTDTVLSTFRQTDGFVLDEFISNTNGFGINLTTVKGSLTAGKYYFKLTALLDNYEEMLVADNSISVDGTQDIQPSPYLTLGRNNSRITALRLYASKENDNITCYKVNEYTLTQTALEDSEAVAYPLPWTINDAGQLVLKASVVATISDELFIEANVTSIAEEMNSLGSWKGIQGQTTPTFQILKLAADETQSDVDISKNISYKAGNYYYTNSADPVASADTTNICSEDYIPVIPGNHRYLGLNGQLLSGQYIVFYKADKTFLSAITPSADTDYYNFTVPEDAVYLRTSVHAVFNAEVLSKDTPGANSTSYSLKVDINSGKGCIFPISLVKSYSHIFELYIKALSLQNGKIISGLSYEEGYYYNEEGVLTIEIAGTDGILHEIISEDYIPVLPNAKYTLVAEDENCVITSQEHVVFYKADGTISTITPPIAPTSGVSFLEFTTPSDAAYIRVGVYRFLPTGPAGFHIVYVGKSLTTNLELVILDESKNVMDSVQLSNVPTSFTKYTRTLNPRYASTGTPSFIGVRSLATNVTIWIDSVSIKASDSFIYSPSLSLGEEMSDVLGYTGGDSLVQGWDQALTFHGRTYFLNPYVDKRYEGFIYASIINAANSFMYDISTADNWKPLDRFSSFKVIGMILFPTMELLILMNNCITSIDPDTGVARNPVYGIGCISRNSIVNVNGIIFWCDNEDMYMLNIGKGLNPEALLEDTIRDLYLAIVDKEKLFCVRDQQNTLRVRVSDSINKTEFLLSKNGWIEEKRYNYPEIYRISANKKLNFLSSGNIYEFE